MFICQTNAPGRTRTRKFNSWSRVLKWYYNLPAGWLFLIDGSSSGYAQYSGMTGEDWLPRSM